LFTPLALPALLLSTVRILLVLRLSLESLKATVVGTLVQRLVVSKNVPPVAVTQPLVAYTFAAALVSFGVDGKSSFLSRFEQCAKGNSCVTGGIPNNHRSFTKTAQRHSLPPLVARIE
jgi:hypothetical protein